jgi:hypothetical protein
MKYVFTGQFGRWLLRSALPLALAGVLLALAPFAVALEVHHELAAADTDGHQHSDTDLCQWVQHHTSNSLQAALPVAESFFASAFAPAHPPAVIFSFHSLESSSPRAPPLS